MKEFKKQLKSNTTKQIDEKISANIASELEKLEQESKKEEYKLQIRQRKQGVKQVLISFDGSMEIIEKNRSYKITKIEEDTSRRILDEVMQRRIWERLEKMYQYTMNYGRFEDEKERKKELSQILDRQIRIRQLLEQYDENMSLLNSSKNMCQNKQMVL